MKYIKLFEGLNIQGFYHIPYSNEEMDIIKIAIKKIKITDKLNKKILSEFQDEIHSRGRPFSPFEFKSLIICIDSKNKNLPWSYYKVVKDKDIYLRQAMKFYELKGYKFLGKITVEDWEIEAEKYNL